MDLDMPESAFHVKLAKNDYLTKLVNQVFLVNQAYVYNVSCAHAQCVSMYDWMYGESCTLVINFAPLK